MAYVSKQWTFEDFWKQRRKKKIKARQDLCAADIPKATLPFTNGTLLDK